METANILDNRHEKLYEFIAYLGLLFLVPLVLGHLNGLPNQFLVGTTVNFLLALSAFRVFGWKRIPLVVLPSVGAYLSGFLFGVNSPFLLFFIPFIWVANWVYVELISRFSAMKNNLYAGFVPSLAKAGLLFTVAYIFVSLSLVPSVFLFAMGAMQFATAISGMFLAILAKPLLFGRE